MMPAQRPGQSKQDYQTPPELLAAIRRDFCVAAWAIDLAATRANSVSEHSFFGPGSLLGEDALAQDWSTIEGTCWLNPPFADIEPWVRKCATHAPRLGRIFALVPASVGANWYANYVHGKAHVVALSPRVSFDGKHPYPKDLILAIYGPVKGGFSTWWWKCG